MRLTIKVLTALFLGAIMLVANIVYRVVFVPEIVSDVNLAHMDRAAGSAPAVAVRAHHELANLGAGASLLFFLAVCLLLFVPEVMRVIARRKEAKLCGKV